MGLIQPSIPSTTEARRSSIVVQPNTLPRSSGFLSRIGRMIGNNYGKIALVGLAALVAAPLNAIYRINQTEPRTVVCFLSFENFYLNCESHLVNHHPTYQWSSSFPWVQQVNSTDWDLNFQRCSHTINFNRDHENTIFPNLKNICISRANIDSNDMHQIHYNLDNIEVNERNAPEAAIINIGKQFDRQERDRKEKEMIARQEIERGMCERLFERKGDHPSGMDLPDKRSGPSLEFCEQKYPRHSLS